MGLLDPVKGFEATFSTMLKKVMTEEYPEAKKITAPRFHGLWVPNWSSASCDLGVFVYQPTEQIARRREAGMATQAVVVTNGRPRVPLTGAENQGQSNAHNWIRRRGHGARPEGIVVSSARSGSSPR
jgi:hypothetical protein